MAPVVKTYQGKKPSLSLNVPPISVIRKEDSFDRLFGTRRRSVHVFSSSSEASASHSRLELFTPESISSYDPSKRKFFSDKSPGDLQKLEKDTATPKGLRKKLSAKKTEILNIDQLRGLKAKLRRSKRSYKKADVLLKPLCESTPIKHSSGTFSSLGDAFGALRLQETSSNHTSPAPKTRSITDSFVVKFGGLNFEEESSIETNASEQRPFSLVRNETSEQFGSQMLELESPEPGDIDHTSKFRGTSPFSVCSMSNDAAHVSVESCCEGSNERLAGGSGDTPHSASAEPTPKAKPSIRRPSGNFMGFDSGEITPFILQKRYEWLDKQKSCNMVDDTPRRVRSMHDIILAKSSSSDQTQNSEDTASTVKLPCNKLSVETTLSSPVNDNAVDDDADPPSVRLSRGKMNLTGGSRSSSHSRHFTTCDELPLLSRASSGDSPDSCQSSDDLSRESSNERDEDEEEDVMVNRPNVPSQIPLHSFYEQRTLEPLQENSEEFIEEMEEESSSLSSKSSPAETPDSGSNRTPNMRRKSSRYSEERSPTGRSSIGRALVTPDLNSVLEESDSDSVSSDQVSEIPPLEHFTLIPGKKYRRSLSILRNIEHQSTAESSNKGRHYRESVQEVIRLQNSTFCGDMTDVSVSLQSLKQRLSVRRSSLMKQMTPPPRRRSAMRSTIYETPGSSFSCRSSNRDSLPFHMSRGFLDVTLQSPGLPSLDCIRASFKPDMSSATEKDCSDISPMSLQSNITPPGDQQAELSIRDLILRISKQTDFVGFSDIIKKECYDGACKLGEGVYGEVFSVRRGDEMTVVKIIPLEGNFCVNEADQKTYEEIIPELLISMELNELRLEETYKKYHVAHGFVEIIKISLVQGTYPPELLDLWRQFNDEKGSDNDNPKIFDDEQIYAVIEQANGGTDLEHYSFSTAKQVVSIFKQIAFSLAVAECAMEFEHRDLHWGNILVSRTKDMQISYWLKGEEYKIPANGVQGTIIDYTLSRITYRSVYPMSCDLSKDPDLFLGTGDFQFDVYRQMKKDVGNEWTKHVPKTNVRWLHYLLDKMQKKVRYQRKTAKVHKDNMVILQGIELWIDCCDSAYSVALKLAQK